MKKVTLIVASLMLATATPAMAQTQDNPLVLSWDATSFKAPGASAQKTFYKLESNYEGVMIIDCSAIQGSTMSDLYVNDKRVGNLISRELIVKRHDVIVFALACQEDNGMNEIKLSYRAVKQGEVWNDPVTMTNGLNLPVIKNNADLAQWYKVSVAPKHKATVQLPYGVASAFTPDNAATEANPQSFENNANGMSLVIDNFDGVQPKDIYVKVAACNAGGEVTITDEVKPGTDAEHPIVLAWDAESFKAPAAGASKTYYKLESNYEGVMTLDCSAIKGSTMSDLTVNGKRVGNVTSREMMVNRHDVIEFALACQEDNSANDIKISYRSIAEGEVWNSPLALTDGTNIPAIKNGVELAKWYKVSVAPKHKATVQLPYGIASAFTPDNAAAEASPLSFENNEKGMSLVIDNFDGVQPKDIYVKVAACNAEGAASITDEIKPGTDIEHPIELAWDAESFKAPAAGASKTYYQLRSNYEGVMAINTDAVKGATMTDLYKNGTRVGNVTSREILVNRGDIIQLAIACQEDNSANDIKISYRSVKQGEIWNMPNTLAEGENKIACVETNVDLAQWYKLSVEPGKKANIQMPYAVAKVFTADNAMAETNAADFVNNAEGMAYSYANQDCVPVDLYVKVEGNNKASNAVVSFEDCEILKGNGSEKYPNIIAWDAESFKAPAAGSMKTYYQLKSNYEGVLSINADALQGYTMSDLYVNGQRVGNVATREILINRLDVVRFAIACQEDNSANDIKLSYRQPKQGDIWNMPIILQEGGNTAKVVRNNVDLAQWYKVTVPANEYLNIHMDYAVAEIYTPDNAAAQTNPIKFENNVYGMTYEMTNEKNGPVDLYIKVSSLNNPSEIIVNYGVAPAEDGSAARPYTVTCPGGFYGPDAAENVDDKTYYRMEASQNGVLLISSNLENAIANVLVNGKSIGAGLNREVQVQLHDIITFEIACQTDNTEKAVNLKYRDFEEGDQWLNPIVLKKGDNAAEAVRYNVQMPDWYKFRVPAGETVHIQMGYGIAKVYNVFTAGQEKDGAEFTNNAQGMIYSYTNEADVANDLYIKVSGLNEAGNIKVYFQGDAPANGEGTMESPYILAWDAEGFNAPAAGATKTYYQLESNNEGVMVINADAIKGSTLTDLFVNGQRVGNVVSREILINRHDVVLFGLACQEDNSANQVKISYRAVAEGDVWNMPIALAKGDNNIVAVANNVDLADWYKVSVAAGEKMTIQMGYAVAEAFTADEAATGAKGAAFENNEKGAAYTYDNTKGTGIVDIYVKISANNEACVATVTFDAGEVAGGNATGIDGIMANGNDKVFDMNGRAVKAMQKGKVYIINGVKVLKK